MELRGKPPEGTRSELEVITFADFHHFTLYLYLHGNL
jgi:hypothetical protein